MPACHLSSLNMGKNFNRLSNVQIIKDNSLNIDADHIISSTLLDSYSMSSSVLITNCF